MGRAASVSPMVRAAGAVVWRRAGDDVEVLLVHRPRYDDWSLPKGKRDPGETDEQCAVREVDEETGVRGRLGVELLPVRYRDRKGRPKVVRYWALEARSQRPFEPGHEVDELRWLPVRRARRLLSYAHDAEVLESFVVKRRWTPDGA